MSGPGSAPRIGTAGWAVPRAVADAFPTEGSGLQRYAARFDAAEINSTFYCSHQPKTYLRWAQTTPQSFRFSVKIPRAITHEQRLLDSGERLDAFLEEARLLGAKLGSLLVQLPPSLAFEPAAADAFFQALRTRFDGLVGCEPRHVSWFEADADALLRAFQVSRVAADPPRHPTAGEPGGWTGAAYWRLHGSPRMYYSAYGEAFLRDLARRLADGPPEPWCIFDNTTSGAAAADALILRRLLDEGR